VQREQRWCGQVLGRKDQGLHQRGEGAWGDHHFSMGTGWTVTGGREQGEFLEFSLCFPPWIYTLITYHAQADNIYVLSPTSPTPLSSHQQPVNTNQIAFCWSGERIFVTTSEGKIRILSYPEFEPILRVPYGEQEEFQLTGHTSSCLTAELQPIGRYLATGGADSIIALWDTQEWICQRTIVSMVGSVKSISTCGVRSSAHPHPFSFTFS
jgi:WD40 repeat protein